MADIRFEKKNNQKKTYSIFAAEITADNIGDTLFTLPAASYVDSIIVVEADGSGVGETVLGGIAASTYYPTGATVTVASGTTATEKVIVKYIETELTCGQYTD